MSEVSITRYLHRDLDREPMQMPLVSQVVVARTERSWFLHVHLEGVRIPPIEVPAHQAQRFLDRLFPPELRLEDVT